jgi:hypothetical protein
MHERAKKVLCRGAFVGCCALPTLFTLCMVIWVHTPWYQAYRVECTEAKLQDWLGMRFEIEAIDDLAPGALRLRGLKIIEPETGTEVARARMVQWVTTKDQMGVSVHQPEFQSAQLEHAWHLLHDRFFCRPDLTATRVRIKSADLTIHSDAGAATATNVDMLIQPAEQTTQLSVSFHLAGTTGIRPAMIAAVRDRAHSLPQTVWTLKSGDSPLPCSALAEYLPVMKLLGPAAEFSGSLHWSLQDRKWQMDLGGCHFRKVELARLLDRPSYKIVGQADLQLTRCQLVDGRFTDLAGVLEVAEAGRVGRDLLAAAEQNLQLQVVPDAPRLPGGDLAFDHLDLAFSLEKNDLRLGLLLLDAGRTIASKSWNDSAVPAFTVASLVAPDSSVRLPLNPQSMKLMDLLPLPVQTSSRDEWMPPRVSLQRR